METFTIVATAGICGALIKLFTGIGLGVIIYNSLIKAKLLLKEGWSGIDVQLKKRHDLIPNLVTVVKSYAVHESSLLEKVTELRTEGVHTEGQVAPDSNSIDNEIGINRSLKTLFAVSENYPELKADKNFARLQEQLTEIEGDLEKARRYYNGTVRNYNIKLESFPSNLVGKFFKFSPAIFFKAEAVARENVEIDL